MRRRIAYGSAAVAAIAVLLAGVVVATRGGSGGGGGTAADRGTGASPGSTATTAPLDRPSPGAAGAGDPYFADLGNGGYDVDHYALDLRWAPERRHLDGNVTIEAVATQWLSSFDLDLLGYDVSSVTVDGDAVEPEREGQRELVITPPEPIPRGTPFTVEVAYAGEPPLLPEFDGILVPGWTVERDGESHVIGEPDGASAVFPCNDHPTDKATYDLRVTVPAGDEVAANGVHTATSPASGGRRTWAFSMTDPMASYLLQVVVGNLSFREAEGPAGVPIRNAVDEDVPAGALAPVDWLPDMIDAFDGWFGPYPFDTYGVVVVDEVLGLALENQTLSLFGVDALDDAVMAHELAHQWFGDHVGPGTWRDIWLNEGFATYAQWLWTEESGGASVDSLAREAAGMDGLDVPPADPGADALFGTSVYYRGALALHALRHAIGDDAFFGLLQAWVERYGGRTATTADFEALASTMTTHDLGPLFDAWLHRRPVPSIDDWVR
jgi:aminopeptidase N